MNIYLLEQDVVTSYDTYSAAVVVAPNEEAARWMHPGHIEIDHEGPHWRCGPEPVHEDEWMPYEDAWARDPKDVKVTLLGVAAVPVQRLVLASFNAG